nr:CDP-glycerol--poly(glycerophosphate) glycerophosphotransferase [Lachnospiraceae bacterium]
ARSQEELRGKIKAFDEQQYRRDVEAFLEGKGSVEDGKAAERVAGLIKNLINDKKEVTNG